MISQQQRPLHGFLIDQAGESSAELCKLQRLKRTLSAEGAFGSFCAETGLAFWGEF